MGSRSPCEWAPLEGSSSMWMHVNSQLCNNGWMLIRSHSMLMEICWSQKAIGLVSIQVYSIQFIRRLTFAFMRNKQVKKMNFTVLAASCGVIARYKQFARCIGHSVYRSLNIEYIILVVRHDDSTNGSTCLKIALACHSDAWHANVETF